MSEHALTPGEWSGDETVILSTGTPKMGHYVAVNAWRGGSVECAVVGPPYFALTPHDRHRMAAVCLYRQDFGFTADDAQHLRLVAQQCKELKLGLNHAAVLNDLATRIEALIPSPGLVPDGD